MAFNCVFSRALLGRLAIAASALALIALPCVAHAQSSVASDSSQTSSSDMKAYLSSYSFDGAPGASASPQYGQYPRRNRYPGYHNNGFSRYAFEIGFGPTAPIGNDVSGGRAVGLSGYNTWGYNFIVGGGLNFNKWLGTLLEYQFIRTKIPGKTLAALGEVAGNINTWSLTLDPIIYMPMSHATGMYLTGGGGFYRKVTNFSAPAQVVSCYYFCYYGVQNQTTYHFSSNQAGVNLGLGLYWKAFGDYSNAKLYAEARYVWVDSPKLSSDTIFNGEGTMGLIPVTVGLRF